MKKKRIVIIGISLGAFIVLFFIFEFITFGGFIIEDSEDWRPDARTEQVTGDFKPQPDFDNEREYSTIIPMILRKITLRPRNTIAIYKTTSSYGYNYERFEYVRFTKFAAHYASGHVQEFEKLLRDGSLISEKQFKVGEGVRNDTLFFFYLDRMERCTVIIEGYSKLKISDKEEFFSYRMDWYIWKKRSVVTRGKWFSKGT